MASCLFTFFEFLFDHALPAIFVLLAFCHLLAIYLGDRQPWTPTRIRTYFRYICKGYLIAIVVYITVCLPFTYFIMTAPSSNINKIITQTRECAYRFEENRCTGHCVKRSSCPRLEKECIALAMCLQQPLFLLRIQVFLEELLAQILSSASLNTFIMLTGSYITWALVNGRWLISIGPANDPVISDTVEQSAILHHIATSNNTPLAEVDATTNGTIVINDTRAPVNSGSLEIFEQLEQPLVVQENPVIPYDPGNLQENS